VLREQLQQREEEEEGGEEAEQKGQKGRLPLRFINNLMEIDYYLAAKDEEFVF